jgi:Domain of unknown function DUF29
VAAQLLQCAPQNARLAAKEAPMDSSALYEADILAWAEQQAAALRSLAVWRDLPNALDLENVAGEIEDVGRSELRAVESLAGNILGHLILLWADPEAPSIRGWRGEIAAWRVALRRRVSPSMHGRVNIDGAWRDAVTVACARLSDCDVEKAARVEATLAGARCPFDLASLSGEPFDVPTAICRLAASLDPSHQESGMR